MHGSRLRIIATLAIANQTCRGMSGSAAGTPDAWSGGRVPARDKLTYGSRI
jgi:hypothetical protein